MNQSPIRYLIAMILILFISACSASTENGIQDIDQEPQEIEATSIPTLTPEPSQTPTSTLVPTEVPTATQAPTATPGVGSVLEAINGSRLMYVPAGEYLMGAKTIFADEGPAHPVYLDAYWIGETEVTCDRFMEFVDETGFEQPVFPDVLRYGYDSEQCVDKPDHPALVTKPVANLYCEWLGMRLTTEAEWEIASRGGLVGMAYPWGNEDPICELGAENGAMFFDGENCVVAGTVPVKSYQPNGYGLYDMAGNAAEWVSDNYMKFYYDPGNYETTPYENPQGPETGWYFNTRGGSYRFDFSYLRCVSRSDEGLPFNGFRCVLKAGE